jgi:hypothetical protein
MRIFFKTGWNYIKLMNRLHPSIEENQKYIKILNEFLILSSFPMDFHAQHAILTKLDGGKQYIWR